MSHSDPAPDRPATQSWLVRRREKVRAEIERNRRGDHQVPTWVLTIILATFVAGWAAVIIFAG